MNAPITTTTLHITGNGLDTCLTFDQAWKFLGLTIDELAERLMESREFVVWKYRVRVERKLP